MNALLSWIDQRTGLHTAWRDSLDRPLAGGPAWQRVWPATILFAFAMQVITGLVLWMYYSPGAQTAWESVYYLQHQVQGGWLLRAVHHYSAQVLLVLLGVYLIQMIACGTYRAPRECLFWVAVLMGLTVLALMLTGDLLAWDQNSYSATLVRVRFLLLLPVVGGDLFKLAIGGPGPGFGHLTITRFFALHAGLFSAVFLALLVLHGWLTRRPAPQESATEKPPTRGWPGQAIRNAVACLTVLAVVLLLAVQRGVELGAPADPAESFDAARPEWAFLGVYEFSHLFSEMFGNALAIVPIFVVPGLLSGVVFLMPFISRRKGGHAFNIAFTAVILVAMIGLSLRSIMRDRADANHQAALSEARALAQRAKDLARSPEGIPVSGALTLLRNDPKTRGPILFEQQCAACHDHTDADGGGIKAEESSAPNLFGFAGRRWLTGLLDPKQVAGPNYFGNTKMRSGDMVAFVKDSLSDLDDDEKKDLDKLISALSAEAQLKAQSRQDAADAEQIAQGRELLVDDFGCTYCHRFRDEGSLGDAPDLTGYGSQEWVIGIISNPKQKRFYGTGNDRMPAYAEFPDEPAKNILSVKDINLLADWLRGDWYEPQPQ